MKLKRLCDILNKFLQINEDANVSMSVFVDGVENQFDAEIINISLTFSAKDIEKIILSG